MRNPIPSSSDLVPPTWTVSDDQRALVAACQRFARDQLETLLAAPPSQAGWRDIVTHASSLDLGTMILPTSLGGPACEFAEHHRTHQYSIARAVRTASDFFFGSDPPKRRCQSAHSLRLRLLATSRNICHARHGVAQRCQTLGGLDPHKRLDCLSKQISLVHSWVSQLEGFRIKIIVNRDSGSHGMLYQF